MANIAVIIANRGWYFTPHFVKSIGKRGPLKRFKKRHQTQIDAQYFESVIDGMQRVVNESGGTARLARNAEITICGKTGTVENPPNEDHSVFIAFAPKENPQIAIGVIVENAGFGGSWAAPIASLLIEKYLTGDVQDKEKEQKIIQETILPDL